MPPVKSITSNDGLACHCTMALELPRLIIMAPHEYACCMIEMSQMANPMKRPQSDNDNRTATVTCVFMRVYGMGRVFCTAHLQLSAV